MKNTRRRYAAKVEKGVNAWRREWSSFMSNVNMKELRKGGSVVLPKSADLDVAGGTRDDEGGGVAVGNFSYLFASPAEKKAARLAKKCEDDEKRIRKKAEITTTTRLKNSNMNCLDGPRSACFSKHEWALHEARQRGLNIDGMTRKEVRQFLRLTISKEQQEAERRQKEFRPHELMDEKLQWYQQGPYPIDIIAEKLVVRKAIKKGKQLGLRYNYLLPHPSWLAKRDQRRRERVLVGLGSRYVFDDAGNMKDVFTVHMNSLDPTSTNAEKLMTTETNNPSAIDTKSEVGKKEGHNNKHDLLMNSVHNEEKAGAHCFTTVSAANLSPPPPEMTCQFPLPPHVCSNVVLADPLQTRNPFVRAVVRDRNVAAAIQRANISTNYISSSLVMGPSTGIDESEETAAGMKKREREAPAAKRVKAVQKRSKVASFELY